MKKNIKKLIKLLFTILVLMPCVALFSACSNGKSAYELAVENGFNGTVEQWLESLKGSNGKDTPQETSYDIYKKAVEIGEFEGTYLEFIEQYPNIASDDVSAVAYTAMASVVSIKTNNGTSGSGVIIDIDQDYNTFIVTNYHVVYGSTSFELNLYGSPDSAKFPAEFVGGSATYDIAVLYAPHCTQIESYNAKAAVFNTNEATLGSTCFAIGNANGDGLSLTKGCISTEHNDLELISVAGVTTRHRVIRHDAFITHGNSGGGLFNIKGELIGVTNGGMQSTVKNGVLADNTSINFAIPSSVVYGISQNIISNCFAASNNQAIVANLNLNLSTTTESKFNESTNTIQTIDTLTISSIKSGSLLEISEAQTGDVIQHVSLSRGGRLIAEKDITRFFSLDEFMLLGLAGDTITITLSRNGVNFEVSVVLESRCFSTIE